MSGLNESANHLDKNSKKKKKKQKKNVNKDCRYLVAFLISCDKHFILHNILSYISLVKNESMSELK